MHAIRAPLLTRKIINLKNFLKFCIIDIHLEKEMTELEAAFFYGDFSQLHEVIRELLSENLESTSIPEQFLKETL
jgi:hypothetical protein